MKENTDPIDFFKELGLDLEEIKDNFVIPENYEKSSINIEHEQRIYNEIQLQVQEACKKAGHKECNVQFSNYTTDKYGFIIRNNLNDIAIEGKVRFQNTVNGYWSEHNIPEEKIIIYRSDVLENPTWLDICIIANESIKITGDYHHCYIEKFEERSEKNFDKNEIRIIELNMGS